MYNKTNIMYIYESTNSKKKIQTKIFNIFMFKSNRKTSLWVQTKSIKQFKTKSKINLPFSCRNLGYVDNRN